MKNKHVTYWARPSEIRRWIRQHRMQSIAIQIDGISLTIARSNIKRWLQCVDEDVQIKCAWFGRLEAVPVRGKGKFLMPANNNSSMWLRNRPYRITLTVVSRRAK